MPLSDEEARLLQQLEQSLAQEDPDFASTLRGSKVQARHRKIAVMGAIGTLAGLGIVFIAAVQAMTLIGVLGFALMVVGAYFFVTAWRGGFGSIDISMPSGPSRPSGGAKASFVDRMEQRWQRRRDNEGF